MTERDQSIQQDRQTENRSRATDDRRAEVKPTDNPVPRSPEAEEEAVRAGEEKLDRLKPY